LIWLTVAKAKSVAKPIVSNIVKVINILFFIAKMLHMRAMKRVEKSVKYDKTKRKRGYYRIAKIEIYHLISKYIAEC